MAEQYFADYITPLEVEPVIRIYDDPQSEGLVIDWNERKNLNPDNLPPDLRQKSKHDALEDRNAARYLGGLLVTAEGALTTLEFGINAQTPLLLGAVGMTLYGMHKVSDRFLRKSNRKIARQHDGFYDEPYRQFTIPPITICADATILGEELYKKLKTTLKENFDANTASSPLLILSEDTAEEALSNLQDAYANTLLAGEDPLSILAQSESKQTAVRLANQDRRYRQGLSDQTNLELDLITGTELEFRSHLQRLRNLGIQEAVLFRPIEFVESYQKDLVGLESILSELWMLIHSLKLDLPAEKYTEYILDLCSAYKKYTQRFALTSN